MDQKKAIVLGIGIIAILGLLAVVFSQLSSEKDMTGNPSVPVVTTDQSEKNAVPIADPKNAGEVSAAIEAQLAEDAKALDAEIAAETAAIEAEVGSINELSQTYDENEL